MRLVLASSSPRRAELLAAAGYTFTVSAVAVDERTRPGEAAADYVRRLASEKSARALELLQGPDDIAIIGADTAVVVDEQILGKPRDDDEARDMVQRLSGRSHEVLTGVSLRSPERELSAVEHTQVWCAALTPEDIEWYISTGEGRDKAGAYAIQGRASRFIVRIAGSYSNVVGLPVALVSELLGRLSAR